MDMWTDKIRQAPKMRRPTGPAADHFLRTATHFFSQFKTSLENQHPQVLLLPFLSRGQNISTSVKNVC